MARQRWADVNGVSLRYELSGSGSTTLVLIHEMGGVLESYDFILEHLTGYRVLRFDVRGQGLSEKVTGELAVSDLADDVAGLLDALAITEPVVIVGCAVGAAIALRFGSAYPERTRAIVAMSPATHLPEERRAANRARADEMERSGFRGTMEAGLALAYPPVLRGDMERFNTVRNQRLAGDRTGVAALTRMLGNLEMSEDLAAIERPTLVLGGRHDGVRPPHAVEPVAKAIAGAELRIIESGHFMAAQTPELVASEIKRFLASRGIV